MKRGSSTSPYKYQWTPFLLRVVAFLTLTLLVLLVLAADNEDAATTLDRRAAVADLLDGSTNFHATCGTKA